MNTIDTLVRENIKRLIPYSSARSEYKGTNGIFLDANENPWGTYNRYPDPFQVKLKEKIAAVKGINPDQLFLGNGSDGIVDMTYRIFCEPKKDKALTFPPTFGMYSVAASINNVELIKEPLDDDFLIDRTALEPYLTDASIKLILLCSPNNPTGNLMRKDDIDYILNTFKGIVVVDEAYIDFNSQESYTSLLDKYPHLIILQTMSKSWGLAGARLGMAIANPEVIHYYNKVKTPYNVSTLNQEAVLDILENHHEEIEERRTLILDEKTRVLEAIKDAGCIRRIYPSDTNFFLVEVNDANGVYAQLIKENIIVRNQTKVIPNCLRITIGKPEENDLLIRLINEA